VCPSEDNSFPRAMRPPTAMLRLTSAWTMFGTIVYLVGPLAAPIVLPLCVVAPAAWHWASARRIAVHRPSAIFVVLALAGLYLLINGTWSLSPSSAYSEIGCFLGFAAALYIILGLLRETKAPVLRAMAIGFIAGMLLGGAFLCFEAFSQQVVHRLLLSYHAPWDATAPHVSAQAGAIGSLAPYLLNRNMTALVLLFWLSALAIYLLDVPRRRKTLLLLGLGLIVAAIFKSEHGTSKIALLGATASFALALLSLGLARRLMVVGWIATMLLVVPMASLAYTKQLYLATSWLPYSARHRIVIWGYTSDQIAKAPLLGAGVSTARALNDKDDVHPVLAPGSTFRLTTGWHSHNAYLQTWYETGAVGALLLLGIGLLVIRALAGVRADVQPFLYATFVSGALMAGSSFSLWAPWFVASFCLAAVFASLLSELASRQDHSADAVASQAPPHFQSSDLLTRLSAGGRHP